MRKLFIILAGIVCLLMPIQAAGIFTVIDAAKSNSIQFLNIEENYKNSVRTYNMGKLSLTGSGLSVDVGSSTIVEQKDFYFPKLNVSVTLPKYAEGLDIKVKASVDGKNTIGRIDPGKGASYTLKTEIDYSKKFEFPDSEISDIPDLQSRIQMDSNYAKSIIQFENQVIQDIVTIMQLKNQLISSEKTYARNVEMYENSKKLGEIAEDSIPDLSQKMTLDKSKVAIESSRRNLETKIEQFEHSYGINYEDVTEAEEPVLEIEEKEEGNTTVYLSYLSMLAAKKNLDTASGSLSNLSVGGSLVPSVSKVTGNSVSASLTANANVGYTSGKLSLTAGISTGYSGDDWISPKVTFSGSWGKNQSSDLNLESLDFKYSQALNSYNDAMYSYRNSIRSLETNVENHKTEVAQLDIQLDYHQRIFEAKQQLFELGLCTKTELDNAQTDIDNDNFQKTILALQGIMLLNQIRLMEL